MELSSCSLPTLLPHRCPLTPTPSPLPSRSLSHPRPLASLSKSGLRRRDVRALNSEETSTCVTEKFDRNAGDAAVVDKVEEEEPPTETAAAAKEVFGDGEKSVREFLSKLDLKLDSEGAYYSILIYGTGALVAVWLSSAVVGALDTIPVVPKVLEVVGLGFTIWFSYRYLIFKQNRDELVAKIEELKEQIIGDD